VNDAPFIHSLKNNCQSQPPSLEEQKVWLENYKKREAIRAEFYFIIRDVNMNALGTVRIYDFQTGSFRWDNWMMPPNLPKKC